MPLNLTWDCKAFVTRFTRWLCSTRRPDGALGFRASPCRPVRRPDSDQSRQELPSASAGSSSILPVMPAGSTACMPPRPRHRPVRPGRLARPGDCPIRSRPRRWEQGRSLPARPDPERRTQARTIRFGAGAISATTTPPRYNIEPRPAVIGRNNSRPVGRSTVVTNRDVVSCILSMARADERELIDRIFFAGRGTGGRGDRPRG